MTDQKEESRSDEDLEIAWDQTEDHTPAGNSPNSTKPIDRANRSVKAKSATTKMNAGSGLPDKLGVYVLDREIGHGGMGVVFLAREEGLDREVALKILPTDRALRAVDVQRFQIEAKAAAQLNHEHIVPVYHVGKQDDIHFYAMKLIQGSDLSAVIRNGQQSLKSTVHSENTKKTGSTPENNSTSSDTLELSGSSYAASMQPRGHKSAAVVAKSVARIGEQVANALHHAHQCGIIHRDIKPSNLLLDLNGNIWVADFGLAHFHDAPELTRTGDLIGTLRYMSPEQASGRRGLVDHRTDIYSLGITLYELATLKRACEGTTMREVLRHLTFERPTPIRRLNARLPRDLETIICKATERNPSDRYQSAEDLATDLRKFANGEVLKTRRTAKWKYLRDWFYERPIVVGLTTAAAILLLATISTAAVFLKRNLTQSEGRRWIAEAWLALYEDKDPGKALAFGLEAAKHTPGYETDQVLLAGLEDLREVKRIDIGDTKPGKLVWSPDGRYLLKCVNQNSLQSGDGRVVLYDVESEKELSRLPQEASVADAAFSPDGNFILTFAPAQTGEDGVTSRSAAIWQSSKLESSLRVLEQTTLRLPLNRSFSPDGRRLVLPGARENEAIVLRTTDWEVDFTLPRQHTAPIIHAVYSPDGKHIATWSADGTCAIWNDDGEFKRKLTDISLGKPENIELSFSPDSQHLLLKGQRGTNFYAVADGRRVHYILQNKVSYSGDGNYYLDVNVFGRANLSDAATFKSLGELEVAKPGVSEYDWRRSSQFSWIGNSGIIAEVDSSSSDIRLFDSQTRRVIAEFPGHQFGVPFLSSHPQKAQFATVGWDRVLRIWNTQSNAETRNLKVAKFTRPSLSFSLDGNRVLASSISTTRGIALSATEQTTSDFDGLILGGINGKQILLQTDDELRLVNRITKRLESSTTAVSSTIRRFTAFDEGSRLLLVTDDSKMYCWLPAGNEVIDLNSDGDDYIKALVDAENQIYACTQNGKLIRISSEDWSRQVILSLDTPIVGIDFDSKQENLLVTSAAQGVMLWKVKDESIETVLSSDRFAENNMDLIKAWYVLDDNHLVTRAELGNKSVFSFWNLDTTDEVASIESVGARTTRRSQDRQQLAIPSSGAGTQIWQLESGQVQEVTELPTSSARFLGNQLFLTTSGTRPITPKYGKGSPTEELQKPLLLTWDTSSEEITSTQVLSFTPSKLFVDPESQQVFASGVSYGGLSLETTDLAAEPVSFSQHSTPIVLAAFLDEGDSAVTVAADGDIFIRNLATRTTTQLEGHKYAVTSAVISPDRRLLVTSDANGITKQWDLKQQKKTQELAVRDPELWGSQHQITSDNLRVVTQLGPSTISIRDLRSDQREIFKTSVDVWKISINGEGKRLLAIPGSQGSFVSNKEFRLGSSSDPNTSDALLIDMATKDSQSITVAGGIVSAEILSDEEHAAFLTSRGVVEVVNLETLATETTIMTDKPFRSIVGFGESESSIAFLQTDGGIEGWNWQTGQQFLSLSTETPSRIGSDGWSVEHTDTDWRFFPAQTGLLRIPKKPARYASELAPWRVEQ